MGRAAWEQYPRVGPILPLLLKRHRILYGGRVDPLYNRRDCERFEVFTAVRMIVFWVWEPCRLVGRCQRFGETYCLHLQGWSGIATVCFSETLASADESTQRQNPGHHHQKRYVVSNVPYMWPILQGESNNKQAVLAYLKELSKRYPEVEFPIILLDFPRPLTRFIGVVFGHSGYLCEFSFSIFFHELSWRCRYSRRSFIR
jgi:hypothetical protein